MSGGNSETRNDSAFLSASSVFIINTLIAIGIFHSMARDSLEKALMVDCVYSLVPVVIALLLNYYIAKQAYEFFQNDPLSTPYVMTNLSNYYRKTPHWASAGIFIVSIIVMARYCDNKVTRGEKVTVVQINTSTEPRK